MEDVNDNKPEFIYDTRHEEKSYLVTISKTTSEGTGIIQIKATDKDFGDFGKVTYSLQDDYGLFTIDTETGIVMTKNNFEAIESSQLPLR